jgi:hypothetical protein
MNSIVSSLGWDVVIMADRGSGAGVLSTLPLHEYMSMYSGYLGGWAYEEDGGWLHFGRWCGWENRNRVEYDG